MDKEFINNLIKETKELLIEEPFEKESANTPSVISFSSGKGGVGKTTLSINIAIDLANKGNKVTLLDADLGLSDGDILLGKEIHNTLIDYLEGRCDFQSIKNSFYGITFISAGSGVSQIANMDDDEKKYVFNDIIKKIDSDYLIIDTGAGISSNTTFFVEQSDIAVVVVTPEPTSIVDAYGLIKTMYLKGYKNISVIINRAIDDDEAISTFQNLARVVKKYFSFDLSYFGFIPEDREVQFALYKRIPVILQKEKSVSKKIEKVSGLLYNDLIKIK
ncbi:MAG: hypothetical protein C0601_03790 [Candidatus Muiribacterium halophilum]|uniref:CobQ/CobB/MinD/ParA nucleotide binding domain-containing protein n=1 Tax=Muiribacterium halophilum TaxID=2053465 RepID=A0A2N5ZJB0_MUIH1|nr:MAG: hypothetical protein C0601_03790 [Candidatus Muirbacterium halophilum]